MCTALSDIMASAKQQPVRAPEDKKMIDNKAGSHQPSGALTRREVMEQLMAQ